MESLFELGIIDYTAQYEGWLGQLYTLARYEHRGKVASTRFKRDCLSEVADLLVVTMRTKPSFILRLTGTLTVRAQGHCKGFLGSAYVIQGTVRSMMRGNLDPAQSWTGGFGERDRGFSRGSATPLGTSFSFTVLRHSYRAFATK
jgi:hypothetical protein